MMKIKHLLVYETEDKKYSYFEIWLMIPDMHTLFTKLGTTDINYLELAWKEKRISNIEKFAEKIPKKMIHWCRGSIKIASKSSLTNKKFSWTRFSKGIYSVWVELNTPLPLSFSKNRRIGIVRDPKKFMIKLRLPRKELLSSDGIKGYMALYYLKKKLYG